MAERPLPGEMPFLQSFHLNLTKPQAFTMVGNSTNVVSLEGQTPPVSPYILKKGPLPKDEDNRVH